LNQTILRHKATLKWGEGGLFQIFCGRLWVLFIDSSTGTSVDDMEKLEKQAQTLAEQAKKNQVKPKRDVLFVR
jgi:hypothetical protein